MAVAGIGLALACGCGQKVVTVVGRCPDGGAFSPSVGCAPAGLLDDLVGYWKLDDATGSMTAHDLTGLNDGTLVDLDPATAWVTGHAVGGLAVEGAGFVNVPRSPSLDSITDQVTISGWGYLEGTIMDYATIASRQDGSGIEQHYHISIDQRTETPVVFVKTDAGNVRLTTATPVVRQTWVHIAGTYDGSFARLYVDGQEVMSQGITGRFTADTTPFILGGNGNNAAVTELFPGRIDEIMLYRRALSAPEIAQLHDGALFR
jgi:hypothetical protein